MSRPDFSDYVAHFTKDAPPFGVKDHPNDGSIKVAKGDAHERLISILASNKILATPMPWTNKAAVAFTECPWGALIDHTKRYSSYGVGFEKALLFAAGGCPAIYLRPLWSARNLVLLSFRPLFMPLPSPVGIRDADRPEQGFLPLGDHTEYGNLKFVAPECLLRAQEYLVPGWSVDGLDCNEPPTP